MKQKQPQWSEKEATELEKRWTRCSIKVIARSLGRSPRAVVEKAYHMSLGGCTRGHKSLARIAQDTGYGPAQILSCVARNGIVLPRAPSTAAVRGKVKLRHYQIDTRLEGKILSLLASQPDVQIAGRKWPRAVVWASKPGGSCSACHRSDRRHHAVGLCKGCYKQRWQKHMRTQRKETIHGLA